MTEYLIIRNYCHGGVCDKCIITFYKIPYTLVTHSGTYTDEMM